MSTMDRARRAPMAMLKTLIRRPPWSKCWTAAPNVSQTRPDGSAARTKRPPREAACRRGLPASTLRNVPAALAATSQDFGLTHWKTAAPVYPTGLALDVASIEPEDVAICHDSHSKT